MIIDIKVLANHERVRIEVPQKEIVQEIPNIVAYDVSNRKIVAIGETVDDLKQSAPDMWARYGHRIAFSSPFDVNEFEPKFASAVLRHYAVQALKRFRFRFQGFDRFNYDLQIIGFENLSPDMRDQFLQCIQELSRPRRIEINGQKVKLESRSWRGWLPWLPVFVTLVLIPVVRGDFASAAVVVIAILAFILLLWLLLWWGNR
jgi:hypothetical protein